MTPLPLRFLLCAVLLTAGACSTAHTARPLGQGNGAIHVSLGGPIVGLGEPNTPLPLATLTGKVGVTDRMDVFAGWHVLETFINNGNAYFDLGMSYYFLDQRGARPGLSGAFTLSPLLNKKSGWASFDLQLTASWYLDPKERFLLYVGMHNLFTPVRSQLLESPPYSFTPYLGFQVRVGPTRALGIGGELKWHRPYANTEKSVIGYFAPGNQGAFAFVAGVTVYIPGKKGAAAPATALRPTPASTAAPTPLEKAPTTEAPTPPPPEPGPESPPETETQP